MTIYKTQDGFVISDCIEGAYIREELGSFRTYILLNSGFTVTTIFPTKEEAEKHIEELIDHLTKGNVAHEHELA